MAYSVNNEGLINPFKGELIENELYQSADDMVDRNNIYSHPIKHGSLWKQKQYSSIQEKEQYSCTSNLQKQLEC